MNDDLTLYELIVQFRDSEYKDFYFEIIFKKFEPLLNKYARLLGDIDMKYYLAESLYNAIVKYPTLSYMKEDRYIVTPVD